MISQVTNGFMNQLLHQFFLKTRLKSGGDMKVALERTFLRVDDQLRCIGAYTTGSTAAVAIVRRESNPDGSHKRVLYVANVIQFLNQFFKFALRKALR